MCVTEEEEEEGDYRGGEGKRKRVKNEEKKELTASPKMHSVINPVSPGRPINQQVRGV